MSLYVQYYCEPNAIMDTLVEVQEPSSCEYVITIYTNRLCSISELKPPPTTKPKDITCHPVLTRPEMDKFEIYQKGIDGVHL